MCLLLIHNLVELVGRRFIFQKCVQQGFRLYVLRLMRCASYYYNKLIFSIHTILTFVVVVFFFVQVAAIPLRTVLWTVDSAKLFWIYFAVLKNSTNRDVWVLAMGEHKLVKPMGIDYSNHAIGKLVWLLLINFKHFFVN